MVSVVAISDLHGSLVAVPPCDLLLIAGDICPEGSAAFQAQWLNTTFAEWLEKLPVQAVVGVAGNHDKVFSSHPEWVSSDLKWHYLQDESLEIFNLKIYGTPWQLPFWGAFNMDDKALVQHYESIDPKTDIILSHGPPFGVGDEVPIDDEISRHTGSLALRNKILAIQPKLVVFGHIHEGRGYYQLGSTVCANVTVVNEHLVVAYAPFSIEVSPLKINPSYAT